MAMRFGDDYEPVRAADIPEVQEFADYEWIPMAQFFLLIFGLLVGAVLTLAGFATGRWIVGTCGSALAAAGVWAYIKLDGIWFAKMAAAANACYERDPSWHPYHRHKAFAESRGYGHLYKF